MFWYVVFVKTGHEHKVVTEINKAWKTNDFMPFVPMYDAKFRKGGIIIPEKRRLFPGYVFIETQLGGTEFCLTANPFISGSQNALKILRYGRHYESDISFQMKNDEASILRKLCNDEHCIGMSRGIVLGKSGIIRGDMIRIIDGPLAGHESRIIGVKRHKMEAIIELEIMGSLREVSVGLELVERIAH